MQDSPATQDATTQPASSSSASSQFTPSSTSPDQSPPNQPLSTKNRDDLVTQAIEDVDRGFFDGTKFLEQLAEIEEADRRHDDSIPKFHLAKPIPSFVSYPPLKGKSPWRIVARLFGYQGIRHYMACWGLDWKSREDIREAKTILAEWQREAAYVHDRR